MFIQNVMLKLRSRKYKQLTAYQLGKENTVYIHRDNKVPRDAMHHNLYPNMLCPYKNSDCSSNCSFFDTSWKTGSIIRCGDKKIGVLS